MPPSSAPDPGARRCPGPAAANDRRMVVPPRVAFAVPVRRVRRPGPLLSGSIPGRAPAALVSRHHRRSRALTSASVLASPCLDSVRRDHDLVPAGRDIGGLGRTGEPSGRPSSGLRASQCAARSTVVVVAPADRPGHLQVVLFDQAQGRIPLARDGQLEAAGRGADDGQRGARRRAASTPSEFVVQPRSRRSAPDVQVVEPRGQRDISAQDQDFRPQPSLPAGRARHCPARAPDRPPRARARPRARTSPLAGPRNRSSLVDVAPSEASSSTARAVRLSRSRLRRNGPLLGEHLTQRLPRALMELCHDPGGRADLAVAEGSDGPDARRYALRQPGAAPQQPVDERARRGLDVGKRLRRELGRDRLSAVRRRVVLIERPAPDPQGGSSMSGLGGRFRPVHGFAWRFLVALLEVGGSIRSGDVA